MKYTIYKELYEKYGIEPIVVRNLWFFNTCDVCPEQYDVLNLDGKMVGYVRLRHGQLTAEVPDVGGDLVYSTVVGNDGFVGCFVDDEERIHYLVEIAKAINSRVVVPPG